MEKRGHAPQYFDGDIHNNVSAWGTSIGYDIATLLIQILHKLYQSYEHQGVNRNHAVQHATTDTSAWLSHLYQHAHYGHPTNCYCLYSVWRHLSIDARLQRQIVSHWIVVRRNTCTHQRGFSEEIVCMTSPTSGIDETCDCEKVISSAIYKTKDNFVSRFRFYLSRLSSRLSARSKWNGTCKSYRASENFVERWEPH